MGEGGSVSRLSRGGQVHPAGGGGSDPTKGRWRSGPAGGGGSGPAGGKGGSGPAGAGGSGPAGGGGHYTAGGMPLAFTQQDFLLVFMICEYFKDI